MRRFIDSIVSNATRNVPFLLLLVGGAFLRLFRLQEFTVFLSDQGRDALIIKDIVTFHHFPLIGAPTSIGQVFLGPAYYYLVAPFLLLFNFNPVGLVYGVVFYALVGTTTCYIFIKREVGQKVALLFTIFVLFSSVQIELSRFSWNPNLLSFTAFFALYYLYKLFEQPKLKNGILLGFFLGLSIQFHYLALLLIPTIGVAYIYNFFKPLLRTLLSSSPPTPPISPSSPPLLSMFIAPFFSFFVTISPLVLFDLRHNFINIKNFALLFTQQKNVPHELLSTRFLNVNNAFYNLFFHFSFSLSQALFLSILLSIVYLYISKKRIIPLLVHINALAVFLFLIFFSFLQTPRYIHYYTPIYLSFSLVLAYILSLLLNSKKGMVFLVLVILWFIRFNLGDLPFFAPVGNGQINHAKTVANFMLTKIGYEPYNIATWPIYFTEDNYIYFLSLAGHPPVDRKKLEITNQMFVLCGEEPCKVINSPSWNISMFGKAKIDKIWTIEGIKIYKLVR